MEKPSEMICPACRRENPDGIQRRLEQAVVRGSSGYYGVPREAGP